MTTQSKGVDRMAETTKVFDVYAWRNNNIVIFGVSQENDGREIKFNLYADTNIKLLTQSSPQYDAYLYVQINRNQSACVTGTLDVSNSTATFDISNCLVPHSGKFDFFIMLVYGETVIKFGGMAFCVINGSIADYVATISRNDTFTQCLADVAELKHTINELIGGEFNVSYVMQFINKTVAISDSVEYKLTASDIAPSSPVYITVKARTTSSDTLVRADGEDLIDVKTGNIVDSTMTNVQVTYADVLAGIQGTDGMSIQIKYYSLSCEDILQMINNSGGGLIETAFQRQLNQTLNVPVSDFIQTSYTEGGNTE